MSDLQNRTLRRPPWGPAWPAWSILLAAASLVAMFVDGPISLWVTSVRLRGDVENTLAIGELFGNGIGVLVVLLTVRALDNQPGLLLRLACCAYVPGLAVNGIKLLIPRVRPIHLDAEQLQVAFAGFTDPSNLSATGYAIQSFPSGHTATAMGLAIGLAWRYPHAAWLFHALALLTATERVMHEAHFLSDTLAATSVAVLIAGGFVRSGVTGWVFDRFEAWASERRKKRVADYA